jgi:hypothetical protein
MYYYFAKKMPLHSTNANFRNVIGRFIQPMQTLKNATPFYQCNYCDILFNLLSSQHHLYNQPTCWSSSNDLNGDSWVTGRSHETGSEKKYYRVFKLLDILFSDLHSIFLDTV